MSDPILSMFTNIEYAVELNSAAWLDRIEQGCLTLEHFFSGNPLALNMDTGRPVKDRRKYLNSRLKGKRWTFGLSNGMPLNGGNIQTTGYMDIGGQTYLGELIYRLRVTIPATTLEAGETVFAAVGDAVQAYFAEVKPYKACGQLQGYNDLLSGRAARLTQQGFHDSRFLEGEKLQSHVQKLGLHLPRVNDYPATPHLHPAQPKELGWLNYWSAETCKYLGFPDPERDRDLLAHSYRTPGGAWLMKLCTEPLDLDRSDHLTIFADVYERFPKLGLRESKQEPSSPMQYPEHTTYIHEGNLGRIIEQLVSLLQARGFKMVESISNKAGAKGVTIGLIHGTPGWTILKTLPEEFLGEAPSGSEEPLLVELCRELRRGGFILNLYNEFEAMMLETDGTGRMSRSGIRNFEELPKDVDFEAMKESGNPPLVEFRLLPIEVETDMTDIDNYGQISEQLRELLAGQNADLCNDENFVALLDGKQIQDRQGVKLCFVRGG
jgi:hypothetical protein